MKTFIVFLAAFCSFSLFAAINASGQFRPTDVMGAWRTDAQKQQTIRICSGRFFSAAIFSDSMFMGTHGGSYGIEGGEWVAMIEFHSMSPGSVGKEIRQKVNWQKGTLAFDDPGGKILCKRIDDGTQGEVAGAWVITGHMRNGQMTKTNPGARRTMKILSGTRVQWISYNVETSEFSGTGGGTYTAQDGKYTENIDFFSRDDARAGSSLSFDYAIGDGNWRHSGMSSRGEPVDEVWTRREKVHFDR